MASLILPVALQYLDQNGVPAAGGTIDFYLPNTTTRKATYQDFGLTVANSNPVVLNSEGRAIIIGSGAYRMVIKDALGNLIGDGQTDALLDDGLVSGYVLPWLSASNLTELLAQSGLGAYIAATQAATALLAGPTGPTGAASTAVGPTGPTGAAGAPGTNGSAGTSGSMQCGTATTDAFGGITVVFGSAFPTAIVTVSVFSVLSPSEYDPIIGSYQVVAYSQTGFAAFALDGNGIGLYQTPVAWFAMGV